MSNANGMNKDSGHQEWYTPVWLIERVRRFYGGRIDLDPASDDEANEIVKAETIYTRRTGGLSYEWFGNVWLNHPYGRDENAHWANAIINKKYAGLTGICYSSTSEAWCVNIMHTADVICFISPRMRFIDSRTGLEGPSAQKGSMLYYYGNHSRDFIDLFHGKISPDGRYTGICLERARS